MAIWRTGKPAGEYRFLKRFLQDGATRDGLRRNRLRSAAAWLCGGLAIAGLCAAGAGMRGVRAQAVQQPANQQQPAAQPGAQSTDSSGTQTDGADELLKEFPADSASKAANDPRDGHTDTPAGTAPPESLFPAAEDHEPQPAAKPQPAAAAAFAPAPTATPPKLIELPSDPKQRQVAIECNDLLTMAADLKAAVDKSTKDQLSLDVVRKAGQIEQYARKVRTATAQAAVKP